MGLITKEIKIKWNTKTKKWYENKGYIFTKIGDNFIVKVEDLPNGSNILVNVKCDNPECKNPYLKSIPWQNYLKCVKEDNKYYCRKCSMELYGKENIKKSKLLNTISFEQWCINNNRQDILDRWDYKLNNYLPSEVCFSSNSEKYYFKCPNGLHNSEPKNISLFTRGQEGSIICNACNSFAQWGIDNICSDFLEKYWDYDKNIVNPWEISYGSKKKIWIKCQEKDYHDSYNITCNNFINGYRCPFCTNANGKVHLLDSLGTLYSQVINIWSDKNKKSPYEYSPKSSQSVWWKCENNIHKDYFRSIKNSTNYNFRCPECQFSKGEAKINKWLIKNNINYIPQKEFNGLIGLGGKNLSYDFYLPDYNLLIEYQGEQHEKHIKGFHKSKKDFKKQQEHDRRKKEYVKQNNINLLEIWYYDYNNIEKILEKIYLD